MRIGVIADTHMPPFDDVVCSAVEEAFSSVELILHAGDLVTLRVLDWLEGLSPVVCARGNNDMFLPEDRRIADTHMLDLAGTLVGMTHVLPGRRVAEPASIPERAIRSGLDPVPHVWVYGDSHHDVVEWSDDVLLVNPGSPTSPRQRVDQPGTVAILTLGEGRPSAEIVFLPVPGHPGTHAVRPLH